MEERRPIILPITNLCDGDIFLRLNGEDRVLGIQASHICGDRGPGFNTVIYEDGSQEQHAENEYNEPKVFFLGHVTLGKKPLRDLLNWSTQYE